MATVEADGEEYLLDVSIRDVKVGEDALVDLTAWDVENRQRNTSQVLHVLLKLLPTR